MRFKGKLANAQGKEFEADLRLVPIVVVPPPDPEPPDPEPPTDGRTHSRSFTMTGI